jgi:serine/threonine protein kinase
MMNTIQQLHPGQLLKNRYCIERSLNRGDFGTTYIATDTHIARNIHHHEKDKLIVKQIDLPSDGSSPVPASQFLFQTESEVLKTLGNHPQIPQLCEAFEENGGFYIIQEFIDGQPLSAELLFSPDLFSEQQVINLLQEILGILHFIHCRGVIHQDLKPGHLIRRQRDQRFVLVDFNHAKHVRTKIQTGLAVSTPTLTIGTPDYRSSEQLQGNPLPSSDIYALGLIAIQSLTGFPPEYISNHPETLEKNWRHKANISDPLAYVLERMVRYHPHDRYRSVHEVEIALQQIQAGQFVMPPPQSSTLIHSFVSTQLELQQQSVHSLEAETDIDKTPMADFRLPLNPLSSSLSSRRRQKSQTTLALGAMTTAIAIALAGIVSVSKHLSFPPVQAQSSLTVTQSTPSPDTIPSPLPIEDTSEPDARPENQSESQSEALDNSEASAMIPEPPIAEEPLEFIEPLVEAPQPAVPIVEPVLPDPTPSELQEAPNAPAITPIFPTPSESVPKPKEPQTGKPASDYTDEQIINVTYLALAWLEETEGKNRKTLSTDHLYERVLIMLAINPQQEEEEVLTHVHDIVSEELESLREGLSDLQDSNISP